MPGHHHTTRLLIATKASSWGIACPSPSVFWDAEVLSLGRKASWAVGDDLPEAERQRLLQAAAEEHARETKRKQEAYLASRQEKLKRQSPDPSSASSAFPVEARAASSVKPCSGAGIQSAKESLSSEGSRRRLLCRVLTTSSVLRRPSPEK